MFNKYACVLVTVAVLLAGCALPDGDDGVPADGDRMAEGPDTSSHGALFTINDTGEVVQDLHRGVCVRVPWGPGKVEWSHSFPGVGGQYFSVAPESNSTLFWAVAPGQNIDAIYNRFWGCGTALKIPDSCTATVTTGGQITTCCNAAMAAFGHVPVWVNTYADPYFVDCPL